MAGQTSGPKRTITTAEQCQQLVDDYFTDCDRVEYALDADGNVQTYKGQPVPIRNPKPYTITGICLALGFNTRSTILDYINRGQKENATDDEKEIANILTRAKLKIEDYAASRLYDKDGCNGAKFTLASNFQGWSEKQEMALSDTTIKVEIV